MLKKSTIDSILQEYPHLRALEKFHLMKRLEWCPYDTLSNINGVAGYACLTPITSVAGKIVTTIEGLLPDRQHPIERAWVAEQVPQCGYCQSGQIMRAAAFLDRNKSPTRAEIVYEMRANLCRCGTYLRIIRAI